MAGESARGGLDHHPCERGLVVGAVVLGVKILPTDKSRNRLRGVVSQISQADAQVVMKRLREADRKA
jgi:hypothetical protein